MRLPREWQQRLRVEFLEQHVACRTRAPAQKGTLKRINGG